MKTGGSVITWRELYNHYYVAIAIYMYMHLNCANTHTLHTNGDYCLLTCIRGSGVGGGGLRVG